MIDFYTIEKSPEGFAMYAHTDTGEMFLFTTRPTWEQIVFWAEVVSTLKTPVRYEGRRLTFAN